MKGIYLRIVVASFGTLVLLLAAYIAVFETLTAPTVDRLIQRMDTVPAEEAVMALRTGGTPALSEYLTRLDRGSGGKHYLTDAQGRDVLTGADRSGSFNDSNPSFIDRFRAALGADQDGIRHSGAGILASSPAAGGYSLVVLMRPPFSPRSFLPYYALTFFGIVPLCWWLTATIGWPLKKLAVTVDRFGRGDLDVRSGIGLRRRDEIGELARAFDGMAERIHTLLTAERRLLQDISHELRSPLARLNIGIELYRTAADRDFAAARLQREADRLTKLVESLLEVTRAEGDPTVTPRESVDLWPLIQETADQCAVEATSRGCELVMRQLASPDTIIGQAELLRRAFENVIRNAIRFAPRGSRVEIYLQGDAAEAEVIVRDFGPGVPPEDLASLVVPFFRVERARDARTGGVGLGLAIVHRAVLIHHGSFVAENAEPGLRVRMRFPSHGMAMTADTKRMAAETRSMANV